MLVKSFNQKTKKPGAWLVNPKDRGRFRIQHGNVYLKNNDNFEIEIHNPLKRSILAEIKINNESISSTGLIIYPGQRIYLDCFLDDKRKFLFNTYEVDGDNKDAIENNGNVEISFYEEKVISLPDWRTRYINVIKEIRVQPYPVYPTYPTHQPFWYGTGTTGGTTYNNNTILEWLGYSESSIETGIVNRGEKSSQKFETIHKEFQDNCLGMINYKILPESLKPVTVVGKVKKNNDNWSDILAFIEKMNDLMNEGILTEEEFTKKKQELLFPKVS